MRERMFSPRGAERIVEIAVQASPRYLQQVFTRSLFDQCEQQRDLPGTGAAALSANWRSNLVISAGSTLGARKRAMAPLTRRICPEWTNPWMTDWVNPV